MVDELRGEGEHLFEARWFVPHENVVPRPATAAGKARLEELHERGFAFGYDLQRCIDVAGKALLAFGATLPWKLSLARTDVSPGYLERKPAQCVELQLRGQAPLRVFTAVLKLP